MRGGSIFRSNQGDGHLGQWSIGTVVNQDGGQSGLWSIEIWSILKGGGMV